jgi:hypothetical protein
MRSLVDDDSTFACPLAQLEGAQDYMEGIKGMSRIKSDIVIRKTFVDGPDVLTWFELHTTVASPVPVANWLHIRGRQDHLLTGGFRRSRTGSLELRRGPGPRKVPRIRQAEVQLRRTHLPRTRVNRRPTSILR